MALTVAELQDGLDAAQAVFAAVSDRLGNLQLDETAAVDILQVASWFDPALLPLVAAAPAIELVINLIAASNKSGTPDSQMRVDYGRKGSDPWLPTDEPAQ
ncbi:MAG: hypothetical protein KGL35_03100 [Bradyrhizobium sp.]|nr:hypothetical protein [Bradyrhizobium sp.]